MPHRKRRERLVIPADVERVRLSWVGGEVRVKTEDTRRQGWIQRQPPWYL